MANIITYNNRIVTRGGRIIKRNAGMPVVGDLYGGGIVAYILQSGDPGYEAGKTKGLIAAVSDQSSGIAWITGGSTQTTLNGNTGTAIGTGTANTAAMAAQSGYTGGAAKVCLDYRGGGYSDWYLPSQGEMYVITQNRIYIGTLNTFYFWTSTEGNATNGKYCRRDSIVGLDSKSQNAGTFGILPIRSFTI